MRIHGIRIHNVLSYGEHHNIIEIDKGSSRFLQTRATITKLERESLYADSQKYLAEWIKDKSTQIISIVGKTESNKRESNGAGKSSILEAISYALYGKLLRETVNKDEDRNKGRSTGSIIREVSPGNFAAEAFVELLFSVNDGLWLLRRGRKLAGEKSTAILRLDCLTDHEDSQQGSRAGHRKADTQATMKALVKWDFETFVNSVMFGQSDSGQFLIGSDKVRKNIIINILNLGIVTDYLEECRARKNATQKTIDSLQAQLDVLAGKPTDPAPIRASIEALRSQIEGLKTQLADLDKEIAGLRHSQEMAKHQSATNEANLKLDLWNQKKSEFNGQIQLIQLQKSQVDQNVQSQSKDLNGYVTQKSSATSGLTLMKSQQASFNEAEIKQELDYVQQAKEAKPVRSQQLAELQKVASGLQFEIGGLEGSLRIKKQELASRSSLTKDRPIDCPTCGSKVTPDHLRAETDRLAQEIAGIEKQIVEKRTVIASNETERQVVGGKLTLIDQYLAKEMSLTQAIQNNSRLSENIALSETAIKSFDEVIPLAQQKLLDLQGEQSKLALQISEMQARATEDLLPYESQYALAKSIADGLSSGVLSTQQAIDKLEWQQSNRKRDIDQKFQETGRLEATATEAELTGERIKTIRQSMDENTVRLNRLKILEQMYGVDGVQTAIVDKYLPLLNAYLNEYIDIVGGGKIHVAIVTDGKKDGKVDLVVTGQCSSTSAMTSGGEKIKIRLAISIALGLLAFARSKDVPEFICLDEVIAPVDDLTKDHIFAMMNKLQEHFRTILVISHDKALQENISHEVVVNKLRGVSRIEKQHYELRQATA